MKPNKKPEWQTKPVERISDGDSSGDAGDEGTDDKADSRKKLETERRAETGPQKQDEQDAVGSPDEKVGRPGEPWRR